MRFDWPGSSSEEVEFTVTGADNLYIHLRCHLPEIGAVKPTTVKLRPEALDLFKSTKNLNHTKETTMAPSKSYNAVKHDYTPSSNISLPGK